MIKVFISYSRKDIEFAKHLTAELQKNKLEFWVDWEGIPPTVDFMKKIEKGIEESDVFLFLVSPDSVISKVCGEEIVHAAKNSKRLIPLIVRDVKSEELPQALSHLNWIFFRKKDNFEESFQKLLFGINTDFEWVDVHSRLLVRALEWQNGNKDNSFLLRGKDLQDAETQLAVNTSKNPHPTDLHREYILKSRQAADRQRRWLTLLAVFAAIVMFALGVYGLREAARANENEQREIIAKNHAQAKEFEATINQISALAVTKIDQNFNEALLLSVEAYLRTKENLTNNFTAQGAITKILQSNPGLIQVLLGHTDWVNILAVSSDGNILASGSWDATVILWDISNPAFPVKLKTLTGHTASVESVAFSSDGKTLASSSLTLTSEGELILWDISDPANAAMLSKTNGGYSHLKFTQGDKILSALYINEDINNFAVLLDVSNKKSPVELSRLESDDENVDMFHIALSPSRNLLFSSLDNGKILEWDVTDPGNPTLLFTLEGSGEYVDTIAISADGSTLALGNSDTTIALWDIVDPAAPALLSLWSGHSLSITSLAFSIDGKTLASSSRETKAPIILWDISDRSIPKKLRTLNGHSLTVSSVAFNQSNDILISGSYDSSIMLWDVADPKNDLELGSLDLSGDDYPFGFAFNPNSSLITSWNNDETLRIWDVSNPADLQKIKTLNVPVKNVAFSPDGNFLASSGDDNIVTLWDAADYTKLGTIKIDSKPVKAIEFSADGKTLATIGDKIILWDISDPNKPAQLASLSEPDTVLADVVFNADGKFMASFSDKSVILWDVSNPASPTRLSVLEGHSNIILSVAFSPSDVNLLATAGADKIINLWNITDPRNPQKINTLSNHSDWINSIAFSPDGALLASGSDDNQINLWNISNPEAPALISKLIGQSGAAVVAFSPLGDLMASLGYDDKIIFWDINSESWAQKACSISGGDLTLIEWNQFFPTEEIRQTCEPFQTEPGIVQAGDSPTVTAVPTVDQSATPIPACTADQIPSCTAPASKKLDEFCTDNNSYGLYRLPLNTTYEVLTPGFTCINEKNNSLGEPRISCTGPTNKEFQVSFCNSTCSNPLETSYQCEAGFGLDSAQGCCAPLSTTENGCVTETLILLGCK